MPTPIRFILRAANLSMTSFQSSNVILSGPHLFSTKIPRLARSGQSLIVSSGTAVPLEADRTSDAKVCRPHRAPSPVVHLISAPDPFRVSS